MLAPPYHDPLSTEEWLRTQDINYEDFLESWKRNGLDQGNQPSPTPDKKQP
jgi:hypothetical protein